MMNVYLILSFIDIIGMQYTVSLTVFTSRPLIRFFSLSIMKFIVYTNDLVKYLIQLRRGTLLKTVNLIFLRSLKFKEIIYLTVSISSIEPISFSRVDLAFFFLYMKFVNKHKTKWSLAKMMWIPYDPSHSWTYLAGRPMPSAPHPCKNCFWVNQVTNSAWNCYFFSIFRLIFVPLSDNAPLQNQSFVRADRCQTSDETNLVININPAIVPSLFHLSSLGR